MKGKFISRPWNISYSPTLLLILITATIFASETTVMLFLSSLPPFYAWVEAVFDSLLLISLLFPVLYFLVFRQLKFHNIKLSQTNEHLQCEIAERRHIQETLQLERNKLKSILDTMGDGVYIVNQQFFFQYINPVLEREFGKVEGRRCYQYFHNRTEICPWCNHLDVLEGKSIQWECYFPKGDRTYHIFNTRITNGDGNISKLGVLHDMTEHKRAEKQLRSLSSQLLTAQESERKRISSELHDELGQALAVLKLRLRAIETNLPKDQMEVKEECEENLQYIDQVIESVRRLSRDLTPSILEDLGLSAALRWLINNFTQNSNIQTSLEVVNLDHLLSKESQIIVYRIFQEAITNIGKHAEATHLSFSIRQENGVVSFCIEDNGKGFDVRKATQRDATQRGLGLAIMDERARMLGGTFDIQSQEGKGTKITLAIPTAMEEADHGPVYDHPRR